jgi:hypothetical protein
MAPLRLALVLALQGCATLAPGPSRARVAESLVNAQETALAQCTSAFLPEGLYYDCVKAAHAATPYMDRAIIARSDCAFKGAGSSLRDVITILEGYAVEVDTGLSIPTIEAEIIGKGCK